ncbi:MAG: DUF4160 domain-containing protein [Ardenticatenaceae bacterium]|nr:DUF4160 domain-containing protein [Ardenticatenaceae bacterium]
MSPTVHHEGPYAFRFYSADQGEPPHIHVQRDRDSAKFWLTPVRLVGNWGFAPHELRKIHRLVEANQEKLLEAWDDYFGS